MKRTTVIILLILFFVNSHLFAQRYLNRAVESITKKDLHAHVNFLASDDLKGRGTPGPELDIAGKYLAAEFEKAGLKPGGDNGTFLQKYDLDVYKLKPKDAKVAFKVGRKNYKFSSKDMLLLLFGLTQTSLDVTAPVVFAGFGITAPEHNWDDYAQLDVQGKVVVVLEGAPWETDLNIPFGYDKLLGKWINAAVHGASAVIYVSPTFGKEEPASVAFVRAIAGHESVVRPTDDDKVKLSAPVVVTSCDFFDKIFERAGKETAEALAQKIKDTNQSLHFDFDNSEFSLTIKKEPDKKHAYNVIGILEGSDPKLKDEYVVLTAHYDHEGVGAPLDGDDIYNGADDNASGTAGLVEVAYAYNMLSERQRPKRSLIFVLVSGEEKLLFGSGYYSENPVVDMSKVIANINADMIGRSQENEVQIIIPGKTELEQIIHDSNKNIKLDLLPDQQPEMRLAYLSDQYHIARFDIPVVFFFTGLHPDYHTPRDEIELCNFDNMEKITKLIFYSSFNTANYKGKLSWKKHDFFYYR